MPLKFVSSSLSRPLVSDLREKYDCVTGSVESLAGAVPRVSTAWSSSDRLGAFRSRIGAYRMRYTIPPGLYAVGEPTKGSDVFVTANYKLSFDHLRRALKGINGWILVLDTKSINVWCAAGKGTFGTEELISRIESTKLDKIVEHRRIIVPQLGAVGVNAATVKKRTRFRVEFGPVRADDISGFVENNYKATTEMRKIRFGMRDRVVLTPMEINPAMKKFPQFALIVLLIFGIQPSGILFQDALWGGLPFILLGLLAVFTGAFLTPALLPYVPFRSFAVKGWIVGIFAVYLLVDHLHYIPTMDSYLKAVAYIFFPMMSSYIALQFTGSTTYTGMSGVKKELKLGVPVYIVAATVSFIVTIFHKLVVWGVI
ncbi:MAG: acetyl-CoA synthase subunit gamma [Nitrospirota bacterium]|nr:MAG: acetyl-CoA synthase subunit gamma [Nitrospirota bacterium]